ncbi:MAG TPA: GNAT family N-acetyltransferase [Thermoanaerobaculia bacterium]|nr:GNAT family N-acetyltransferase [Thermoanaerobaculia bacterium]
MVTFPAEGRWSLRAVADDDARAVASFLSREPLINVYLLSRLEEERSAAATQMIAVRHDGEIVMAASLATNVVLAGAPAERHDRIDTAASLIADRIITRMLPVRAIISPAHLVESLWSHLRSHLDPPTVVRMTQPTYALRPRLDFPDLRAARYGKPADLDRLVPACAAMHKEEVGIDPLLRDPAGYRERVRELVDQGRSIVRIEEGEIVAKCEFSAVTATAVQLMGVWTHPRFRRHGLARETLREVCGHLFRKRQSVTLFVNDFNRPAIALYESLGFTQIGINRALIW